MIGCSLHRGFYLHRILLPETESRREVTEGWVGEAGSVFHGDRASVWEEENTLGSWTMGRVVMVT